MNIAGTRPARSTIATNGRPERAHEVGVVWALLGGVFF